MTKYILQTDPETPDLNIYYDCDRGEIVMNDKPSNTERTINEWLRELFNHSDNSSLLSKYIDLYTPPDQQKFSRIDFGIIFGMAVASWSELHEE